MRAITGAVVSSKPCTLKEAYDFLREFCKAHRSHLEPTDCGTYLPTLTSAIRNQHLFLRRFGQQQQGADDLDAHGYERLVEGERERQGGEKDSEMEVPVVGPHGSVREAKVAVSADEKKSKKRKKGEELHEDKAVAGAASHIPASPEIFSEQRRKKRKEKCINNMELVSVVKQEPDLVVEVDLGSERQKKKKEKYSDNKESAIIVKQEPGLVVEEELGSEKKGKKKKDKVHVKLEVSVVEVKAQIVNNGVADQGIADREKKRKKKKQSEEEGNLKDVKQEEKMAAYSDLNREKKKKKRGREDDDDDNVQEQGQLKKKKQRKES